MRILHVLSLSVLASFVVGACSGNSDESSSKSSEVDDSTSTGGQAVGGTQTGGSGSGGNVGSGGTGSGGLAEGGMGGGSGPTCTDGEISCDGSCVDPLTNVAYCGAKNACAVTSDKGEACAGGSYCIEGACVTRSSTTVEDISGTLASTARHVEAGISDAGDALVLVRVGQNTNGPLYWSARDAGASAFTDPQQLSVSSMIRGTRFNVATSPAGPSLAGWREEKDGVEKAMVGLYTPGSGWTSTHIFFPDDTSRASTIGVAYSEESGPFAVVRSDDNRVYSSRYVDDKWSAPEVLDWGGLWDGPPDLAVGGAYLAAAFYESSDVSTDVVVNLFDPAMNKWLGPQKVATGKVGQSFGEVRVAVNDTGAAVVTFYDEDDSYRAYFAEYEPDAKLWTVPVSLAEPTDELTAQGIAINNAGEVQILYSAYPIDQGVFVGYQRAADETVWTNEVPSILPLHSTNENSKMGYDSSGNLHLQWFSSAAGDDRVDMSRLFEGQSTWSSVDNLEATTGVTIVDGRHDLFVAPNGRSISTWIRADDPRKIRVRLFE